MKIIPSLIAICAITSAFIGNADAESDQRFVGVTRASHDVQLVVPVEGVVAKVLVVEGQRVAKGETLLSLESAIQQAEAQRRELIKADMARINTLKHNVEIVKSLLDASRALFGESGSISEEEVKKLEMQHVSLQGELFSLQAQKKREAVEYQAAVQELQRRTLVAPRAGIVSEILVEAGEWATPQQAVVRLVDPSECYLEINIEERHARAFRSGEDVAVTMAIGAEPRQIPGHILFVAPIADQASGLVRVKIGFDNRDGEVWPGLPASVALPDIPSGLAVGEANAR